MTIGVAPTTTTNAGVMSLANHTSQNWAGAIAYNVKAKRIFNWVQAEWTVPPLQCPTSTETDSSQWIGLGGFLPNEALYQTGTSADCVHGKPVYKAWWEIAPNFPEEDWKGVTVHANDLIVGTVQKSGGTVTMEVQDESDGGFLKYKTLHSTVLDSSAECIVERPTNDVTGAFDPLANFGTVDFLLCQAQEQSDSTYYPISPNNAIPNAKAILVDMENSSGQKLATTDSPHQSQVIYVTWEQSA